MRANDIVSDLRSQLQDIVSDGTEIWQRQDRAARVRFCRWAGQSADGRKHAEALGEDAWPFEGAADTRVPLVDSVINDKVATACTAFWRAQLQAIPLESSDVGNAQTTSTMLRWLRDRALRAELQVEVELAAQYLYGDDPGLVVVEVQWWRDLMLEKRDLSFDELGAMYAAGATVPDVDGADPRLEPEMLGDFADLMTSPLREREALAWLRATFPGVVEKAMRAALRQLRREGRADLPVPVVRQNRPCVQALRLFDDIFFPVGTADLQRARSVHRREWVSEVELRERVATLAWDAEWVDEVLDRARGQTLIDGELSQRSTMQALQLSHPGGIVNERDNLFEIWWTYERRADDLGLPGIYCTVWNGSVRELTAKSELVDLPHGLYPFVLRGRERIGRQVTESRGSGRAIETHQMEVKVQRDARSNYTQLATTPPRKVKMQRGAWDLVLGPGSNVPVQRMDDFDYLTPPPFPQASIEIERTTRAEVDEYTGRNVAGADKDRVASIQQHEIDNFFALWREVFSQALALCQAYFSPVELARITGPSGEPMNVTPGDLRGGFDVLIELDARDLNMEFAMKKLDSYTKLRALDAGARMDEGELVSWGAAAIDPILARRTIRPEAEVSAREVKATKDAVAQMAVGIEADMPTQGINPRLRLQVVQQTVQNSPTLLPLYQAGGTFRDLVDNYLKYLQQQVNQQENMVSGKLGTKPLQGGMLAG